MKRKPSVRTFPGKAALPVLSLVLLSLFSLLAPRTANASSTAVQSVSYEVQPIQELALPNGSNLLVIDEALTGEGPKEVCQSSAYAVTTNGERLKIMATLNEVLPPGATLTAWTEAPTGAVSTGPVLLTERPAALVTGISRVAESGLSLTFCLGSTGEVGYVGGSGVRSS